MEGADRESVIVVLSALAHAADQGEPGALKSLAALRVHLENFIASAVAKQRAAGATWQEIGDALGTNRSAAQQRYGRFVSTSPNAAPPPSPRKGKT